MGGAETILITKTIKQAIVVSVLVTFTSWGTSYVAKPLPFKLEKDTGKSFVLSFSL